jgi:hypothetical protein
MRSDVKTALKSHLDNLNNDQSHQPLTEKDKEHSSEANPSIATSEISNCDSKDIAELDSMLSSSPRLHGDGHNDLDNSDAPALGDADDVRNSNHGNHVTNDNEVAHNDNVIQNDDVIQDDDVTRNDDVDGDDVTHDVTETSEISTTVEDDKELSSVEKSKKVLFNDDRNILDERCSTTFLPNCSLISFNPVLLNISDTTKTTMQCTQN